EVAERLALVRGAELHVRHAERLEDLLAHQLLVARVRRPLGDGRGDDEAGVAVLELLARRPDRRLGQRLGEVGEALRRQRARVAAPGWSLRRTRATPSSTTLPPRIDSAAIAGAWVPSSALASDAERSEAEAAAAQASAAIAAAIRGSAGRCFMGALVVRWKA